MINKIGSWISWLNVALVLLICLDVILRYVLNVTEKWVIELEWHIFAAVFLLGASYTFKHDKHVRVDLFYQKFSEERKMWIDLIGNILFLIPWCIVVIYASVKYANVSFSYLEGSPDPNGLPARYVIKYIIALGFVLLLIQAVIDSVEKLKHLKWN
ncbi:TRAP transporter small permease subunit [Portibacter marinus]|uniref:TRAP transporter small permease subunit n=1 Tax=Portibacter marinus TaxID=2898660 RepID=UPI001F481241|nr:TRAP transporter small permease subunit [Portibacter marinus]